MTLLTSGLSGTNKGYSLQCSKYYLVSDSRGFHSLSRLSVERHALRAFVFVLILSLKKAYASEKSKRFGAFGGHKFSLLVEKV